MTATPHNGKEEDFQLFLALLDADRFEGKPRDGVARGRRVGPDAPAGQGEAAQVRRHAAVPRAARVHGRPTRCPTARRSLYKRGHRVRARGDEPRRAAQGRRRGAPRGRRRLRAHHPAAAPGLVAGGDLPVARAADGSGSRTGSPRSACASGAPRSRAELGTPTVPDEFRDVDEDFDVDDLPDGELEELEEELVDQASAARTIAELEAEIATPRRPRGAGPAGRARPAPTASGRSCPRCCRTRRRCSTRTASGGS